MPKSATYFRSSPHKEEAMQALREGASIDEVMKRFGLSSKTVKRCQKEIEAKTGVAPKAPKRTLIEGGKLATVVGRQPAPIIFTISEQPIELDPQALYEGFLLYEDLKARGIIVQDGFSDALKDGIPV